MRGSDEERNGGGLLGRRRSEPLGDQGSAAAYALTEGCAAEGSWGGALAAGGPVQVRQAEAGGAGANSGRARGGCSAESGAGQQTAGELQAEEADEAQAQTGRARGGEGGRRRAARRGKELAADAGGERPLPPRAPPLPCEPSTSAATTLPATRATAHASLPRCPLAVLRRGPCQPWPCHAHCGLPPAPWAPGPSSSMLTAQAKASHGCWIEQHQQPGSGTDPAPLQHCAERAGCPAPCTFAPRSSQVEARNSMRNKPRQGPSNPIPLPPAGEGG